MSHKLTSRVSKNGFDIAWAEGKKQFNSEFYCFLCFAHARPFLDARLVSLWLGSKFM